MKITEEIFEKAVGRKPENDDLERCNCSQAGKLNHFYCGWNTKANLPNFMSSEGRKLR